MATFEQIPPNEIQFFKEKVQRWLHVDNQITQLEAQIRDLKKVRNKELEPLITEFMNTNNITDLNTNNGKIRCAEKNTKKGFNKTNIRNNLSKFITDEIVLDSAINELVNNREIVTSYKLKIVK